MDKIKPNKIKPGDTIGIISPSSTIKNFPRRLQRGIDALEKMGFKIELGKNALKQYGNNAGTAKERAEDVNNFFADENIKAIICSTGGETANSILPLLDFGLIKNSPKVFCGFSDITTLNLAINSMTGLITFNGPTVLPTLGEFEGVNDFTLDSFKKAVCQNTPIGTLYNPEKYTEEVLWWETADDRKKEMSQASQYNFITPGSATGRIIGGNFLILCTLIGTKYFPDLKNCILFLEDEGESASSVDRRLNQLEQVGVFDKINGLIFARPFNFKEGPEERTLKKILKEFGEKHKIPIVCDLDCGHTNPLITIPIGVDATIDSNSNKIEIIESAVL